MFVVCRCLGFLCSAALLEEEGRTFDHEEALTEAEKQQQKEKKEERSQKTQVSGRSRPGDAQSNYSDLE